MQHSYTMNKITAKEAKLRFGQMLDRVQREPVTITKNGRPVALVVALEDAALVEAVQELVEDHYWGERAANAEEAGYLTSEESEKLLNDCLNA